MEMVCQWLDECKMSNEGGAYDVRDDTINCAFITLLFCTR